MSGRKRGRREWPAYLLGLLVALPGCQRGVTALASEAPHPRCHVPWKMEMWPSASSSASEVPPPEPELRTTISSSSHNSSSSGRPPWCPAFVPDDHRPVTVTLRSGEKAVVHGFTEPRAWEQLALALACLAYVVARLTLPRRRRTTGLQEEASRAGLRDGGGRVFRVVGLEGSAVYLVLHALLLELHHSPPVHPAEALAADSSHFLDVPSSGLRLHYLLVRPGLRQPPGRLEEVVVVHASHGFGASSLSWHHLLPQLSHSLNALALAHDAPGFGLTEVLHGHHHHPLRDAELFGFHSSARLGHALLQHHRVAEPEEEEEEEAGSPLQHVFVGHSMGGMTSSLMALQQVERQRHHHHARPVLLVLEAPAVLADPERSDAAILLTRLAHTIVAAERQQQQRDGSGDARGGLSVEAGGKLGVAGRVALSLLRAVLRQCVYRPSFWSVGLTAAWTPLARPDNHAVTRYRVPSLKHQWDAALARFILACWRRASLSAGLGLSPLPSHAREGGLVERLADAAESGRLRVLVVHGRDDPVIPVDNSRQLVDRIPHARLVEVGWCGHIPHEEAPEAFLRLITTFVRQDGQAEAAIGDDVTEGDGHERPKTEA